jgi:hypothetical protein
MAAFEPGLFAWATVMSRRAEDRAIVDAGLKALAFDSGPSLVCDEPAATYERASDAHGGLAVSGATNQLGLGDKIRLIPGHCDPPIPTLPSPARGGGLGWGRGRVHIPGRAAVGLQPTGFCPVGLAGRHGDQFRP